MKRQQAKNRDTRIRISIQKIAQSSGLLFDTQFLIVLTCIKT